MQALAQNGKLSRVWLFTGPRGTGKTSTARIIAAMMSSQNNAAAIDNNYGQQNPKKLLPFADPDLSDPEVKKVLAGESYSVVEIDAASHRGIDDVRQLQEQLATPPTMSKMLVYILDEVHMFSPDAFNALLKTLEEPPSHCIFILATTEKQKVPATVVSRCTLMNFRRATEAELLTVFEKILQREKITAEKAALQEIAKLADGSFRDGVKLLQTVANLGEITTKNVAQYLGGEQQETVTKLVKIILAKDESQLVDFFAQMRANGVDEKTFIQNLFDFLYQELVNNIKKQPTMMLSRTQAQFLLTTLVEVKIGLTVPYLDLELKILQIFSRAKKSKK